MLLYTKSNVLLLPKPSLTDPPLSRSLRPSLTRMTNACKKTRALETPWGTGAGMHHPGGGSVLAEGLPLVKMKQNVLNSLSRTFFKVNFMLP